MYQSFRLHLCKTGEVRETHEDEQKISKKLQFFPSLRSRVSRASLAWVKGTEKSPIPRT